MFREIKSGIFIFVVLALVVGTIGGCEPGVQKEPVPLLPGHVVAIVNGEEITEGKLAQRTLPGERKETALNKMIDEVLIFQAAAKEGIEVDERKIARRLKIEIKPLPGEEISPEMMRAKLRRQLKMELVIEKLYGKDIKISEKEMKDYFEAKKDKLTRPAQVRIHRIKVDRRAEAESILKQLRAGVDFAGLAGVEEFAIDEKSDLGFYKATSTLKEGEVSEIMFKPGKKGFEIAKVLERTPAKKATYGEAKEEIRQLIFKEKLPALEQRLLSDLRKEAKIEIKMPGAQVSEPN